MTSKNPGMAFDTEGVRKAFEGMGKVVAEVGFQLAAQGALGYLLQDQAEQTGAILDRMTEEQHLRLWIAAGALAGLASVGLDQAPAEDAEPRPDVEPLADWEVELLKGRDTAPDLPVIGANAIERILRGATKAEVDSSLNTLTPEQRADLARAGHFLAYVTDSKAPDEQADSADDLRDQLSQKIGVIKADLALEVIRPRLTRIITERDEAEAARKWTRDSLNSMTTDRQRWRLEAQGHRDTIRRVNEFADALDELAKSGKTLRILASASDLRAIITDDQGTDEQPEPAAPEEGGYRVIAERLAQAWPDDFGRDPVYTDQVAAQALAAVLPRFDQWRTAAHHYIRIVGRIEEYANRLDEQASADRDWSLRAKVTADNLRAIITDDQPTKFETTGDLREQHDAHRRRLADALDATPCRNWDQLLTLAEQTHDTANQARAEQAEASLQVTRLDSRARRAEAEAGQLRGQVEAMTATMERFPDAHMRFGIIGDHRSIDDMPCADWCYACKLQRAEEEAERLRTLANEILVRFNQHAHPGRPCTRASWTPDDVVANWRQRAALLHTAQPDAKDQPTP